MDFQLYTDVVLVQDSPEENLRSGDVGVVVDRVAARIAHRHYVAGLETGYSVGFFDMLGKTVAVTTLPASMLRSPTHLDRPAVRSESIGASFDR